MKRFELVITGARGFVGEVLSAYLKNYGYSICRISLRDSWKDKFPEQYDGIIHLAGIADDTNNTLNPEYYFQINTELTKRVFDDFIQSSARDFIYFSSVKAVADAITGILDETLDSRPITPYGQSKRKAEEYILSQELPIGKRAIILRPCLIHGPGNKGNLALLHKVLRKGIPWPLAAFDGHRSFLSIDNLCFIVERMLGKPEVPGAIYNVADDDPISINQLIQIIAETTGRKARFLKLPSDFIRVVAKAGDTFHLPFNTEKLNKLTESYIVSNEKVKRALALERLPVPSREGLINTIMSFENMVLK